MTGMILFESFCLFIVLPLLFLDQAKGGFFLQAYNFIDKSCFITLTQTSTEKHKEKPK
jgi:hypothetical protein